MRSQFRIFGAAIGLGLIGCTNGVDRKGRVRSREVGHFSFTFYVVCNLLTDFFGLAILAVRISCQFRPGKWRTLPM